MSKKNRKEGKELKEDLLKKARAKRLFKAGISEKEVEENTRDEFRKYFIQISRKLNLKKEMEEVLWLHLRASGHDKKDKFNAGLENFGYKLS